MGKKEFKKKAYVKPTIEEVRVNIEGQMLAGSPPVETNPIVLPPTPDDDEELFFGTKKFNMWSEWED